MKKNSVLCLFFLFLICFPASAEEAQKLYNLSIGLETYYHSYEEPGLMENEGIFYGLSYSLSYQNKIYLGFEGLFSYGQVDYSSASTGESDDIDDVCSETRILAGYVINKGGSTKIIPYAGIAYRFLQDDSESKLTTTDNIGYLRESNYYYSPVGIRMDVDMGNGWYFHPEIEYNFFWAGVQTSDLGYLSGYEDIENDQEDGHGYRISLTFKKKTPRHDYSFRIFYRYWDIDDSEVTVDRWGRGWIEPKNETNEYGFNFSFIF